MATIVETIAGDRRIQLSNEEIVRQMSHKGKWSKIAVGVRFSINLTADIHNPKFIVGVCSGSGAIKPASVTAAFGVCIPQATGDLVYNAGPPAYYNTSNNAGTGYSKVGSTVTTQAANWGVTNYAASTSATPHMVAYQFTKTGNVITAIRVCVPMSAANVQAGNVFIEFMRNLENEVADPVLTKAAGGAFTTLSLTNSSDFDHVFAYWDQASPTLEISDMAVVKFS